jgi:hypothetical protein
LLVRDPPVRSRRVLELADVFLDARETLDIGGRFASSAIARARRCRLQQGRRQQRSDRARAQHADAIAGLTSNGPAERGRAETDIYVLMFD